MGKKSEDSGDFILDEHQVVGIMAIMIIQEIRRQIGKSKKSRYKISHDTRTDEAALCRIMQGGSCKVETADKLLKYFGVKLVSDKKQKANERKAK